MDPNSTYHFAAVAWLHKLQEEMRPQSPFEAYDSLTPDEPGAVGRFVSRLLKAISFRAVFKSRPALSQQAANSQPIKRQTAPLR
jgi:hypothetical protein